MGTACASLVARCARGTLRSSEVLCAIPHRVPLMLGDSSCWPNAIIEGHICLQPRRWYPACCSRDSLAMVPPSVIPEHYAPIQVVPGNPSQSRKSESIRQQHRQSILHIITYYKHFFIFDSFACTGRPDPIDPGRFKFASRDLVELPILMPLIDTNGLLQVQVDSEVNSDLSQVLVEDRSGSRPGHSPLTENEGIIVLKNLAGP